MRQEIRYPCHEMKMAFCYCLGPDGTENIRMNDVIQKDIKKLLTIVN
jgi:hypothetical protein